MQLVQLILPSLATVALGSAMLLPHREERSARRAGERARVQLEDAPETATFAELVETLDKPLADAVEAPELPVSPPSIAVDELRAPLCDNSAAGVRAA